ncbi:hypothetical protein ACILDS_02635 [Capnocytophaga canis]|uniref:hypothetical protein n=1 Tax=Capnocytophaga canis TaxID=1848903 RepID=UPI0037D65626
MKDKFIIFCGLFWSIFSANSQEIKVETDTKNIKIGEQIRYKISVETTTEEPISFPEGQTFMPLEMVRSSAIDTMRKQEKYRFIKEYFLTQFDSGSYTIPRQKIIINSKDFYTDSLLVEVRSIPIDTLKQPLFDVKPIIGVNSTSKSRVYLWVLLGIIIIITIGFLVYYFFFHKKKLSEEELRRRLPPFERAIEDLKKLQNSKYLIESNHKAYYSKLTDIVREYLEDDVHILAKESTTDELLSKIKLMQENGSLNLSEDTVKNLKSVLQTADLVKFAKSKPADSTAEYDRKMIEEVIIKTKQAIPQVIETTEDLSEKVAEIQNKNKKRKLVVISGIACTVALLIGSLVYFYADSITQLFYNSQYIKELYEKKWVTSDYGVPITELSTPEILKRKQIVNLQEVGMPVKKQHFFEFGSIHSELYVMTSIITFHPQTNGQQAELNPELVNNLILSQIEAAKATNITTFTEEYTSTSGAKGMKVYGKMVLVNEKTKSPFQAHYELYSFTENGALQQLLITHIDDPNAYKIAEKIVNSIHFKRE